MTPISVQLEDNQVYLGPLSDLLLTCRPWRGDVWSMYND